jgi:tyrosyl-tRNA synthetase
VAVGAAKSNGEARRLIKQGGVRVGDEKVQAEDAIVTESDLLAGDAVVLRVGKKRQFVARFG